MGSRGPKPKGALYHIMRGNYGLSRHGLRPETPKDDDWIKTAWAILRESAGIPAPEPRGRSIQSRSCCSVTESK
jgi:hypothetical protein